MELKGTFKFSLKMTLWTGQLSLRIKFWHSIFVDKIPNQHMLFKMRLVYLILIK